MSVHAYHIDGVSRSERREGANGVGGRIRVEGGNGDGNGVGGVNIYGDGCRDGKKTGVEVNEGT